MFLWDSEVWVALDPCSITWIQHHIVLEAQLSAVCSLRTSGLHMEVISVTPKPHWKLPELSQVPRMHTDICVSLVVRCLVSCSSLGCLNPQYLLRSVSGTAFLCLPACEPQCLYSAVDFA